MPLINFFKKILRNSSPAFEQTVEAPAIPRNQHSISKTEISPNALQVINHLNHHNFQAYLVGGSVRDLLLRKVPKDYDVATNATPQQIKRLFRNGRIIGRRFKLVHITFQREIIEVSTFRSNLPDEQLQTNDHGMVIRDNVYGTLEQDAWRRDFTINSLYYDVRDGSIVDYTNGFPDIKNHCIQMIGDPTIRYQEDPVRMLRAIRFAAKLHFQISPDTAKPITRLSHLIQQVSNARLFDEVTKLWQCHESLRAFHLLLDYQLFEKLFPWTQNALAVHENAKKMIEIALENTDLRMKEQKPTTPAFLYAILLWFPMRDLSLQLQTEEQIHPLAALEKAMGKILLDQSRIISIPRRFVQLIREIWLLQYRFSKRVGLKPMQLMNHTRFRAAYDFLGIRALAGDESLELADWWTQFQDADEATQLKMIEEAQSQSPAKPKRKRRRKKAKKVADNPSE
jgi:poly(A) polymerase